MSGPKGASYRVECAEERARRQKREAEARKAEEERQRRKAEEERQRRLRLQMAEAKARFDRARSRVVELYVNAGETDAMKEWMGKQPAAETVEAYEIFENEMLRQLSVAEKKSSSVSRNEAKRDLKKAAEGASFRFDLQMPEKTDARTPEVEKLHTSLDKLQKIVSGFEDEKARESFVSRIERLRTAADTKAQKAKADLLKLQTAVGKEQKRQRECEAVRRKAEQLLLDIAHIEEGAEQLRERLETATTREQLTYLVQECKRVIERQKMQDDADYVARAVVDAFAELGFGQMAAEEPGAAGAQREYYLIKDGMKHNAVMVAVNDREALLETRVVALDDEGMTATPGVEAALCKEIFSAFKLMESRGVRCQMRYQKRPGEVSAERVAPGRKSKSSGRRAGKIAGRQRGGSA
jgi:hypothetical protein